MEPQTPLPPPSPTPSPATLQPPPDAEERQRRLDRMKRTATGLLAAMAAVFAACLVLEPHYPWLAYVRATSEAAMVGGIADWFAITALFRHPMGVKIPHTAIIPNRKDRIGRTLGNFVENNFLSDAVLAAKLRSIGLTRGAAEWLKRPENSRSVARQFAGVLRSATEVVRDEDVHALLERSVIEPLRDRPVAPVLAHGLALLTANDRHQQVLDRVIQGLAGLLTRNQSLIRQRIEAESPWWVPGFVDDRVHARIVEGIEHTLLDVASDQGHPLRRQFDELLEEWVAQLQTSPAVMARADEVKRQLFDHPTSRRLSASLWEEVKRILDRQADLGPEDGPGAVERGLVALAEGALEDEALLAKVDGWLIEAALRLVRDHRHEFGQLIANTVSAWDPEVTSWRIELAVGRDLQFVRINGTVVGGLVGLALYIAARLAGVSPF